MKSRLANSRHALSRLGQCLHALASSACYHAPQDHQVSLSCTRHVRRLIKSQSASSLPDLRNHLRLLGVTLSLTPLALVILANVALADPVGGVVVSGDATINQATPGQTVIQQNSNKAVINWQDFSIGAGEHTQFVQPGTDSITLNRVTGPSPSEILGRLSANGNIMLINQNGIMFGKDAHIDVGGLIATTADITNDDFNSGNLRFSTGGKPDAAIKNLGTITARTGGAIALVAPFVSNEGTITAHLGKIQLASGNTWALDMGGLVKLAINDKAAGALIQAGLIQADGGRIELTANVVESMLQQAIQVSGTTQAHTVGLNQQGNIVIGGNAASGTILVDGQLDVSGLEANQHAGQVTITADRVALLDGANINAQGHSGGGSVKIGGDYQGSGSTYRASRTYIGPQATINASATDTGDGGRVIVWSNDGTQFYGNIYAQGGAISGNGGFTEVSGLGGLDFNGQVNTAAFNGENGTLLLDPFDLTISNAGDSNVTGTNPFSSTANNGILNVTTLQNALGSGNVTVQTGAGGSQNGDITVTDAIAWTGNNSLTLQAHRNISVNNTITNSGGTGGLTLASTGATGAITVGSAMSVGGDMSISANTLALNANISGGGTLSLFPNLANTTITVGTGGSGIFNLDINEFGRIQNGWSNIVLGRADGTAVIDLRALTWSDNLTLQSLSGAINVNGIQNVGGNDLTIRTNSLNVANALTGTGTLTIEPTAGNVTMGFGASATGTLNLDANEVSRLTDGWNLINLGRTDSTVGMQIRATNWSDPVVFRNGTGAITTSSGNMVGSGNASFTFNSPMTLSNNITTASGSIIFNNPFTVGSGLTPIITTTSGTITFNSTIDGVAGGSAENLTITGGTGSVVDFTNTIGATAPLGNLSVTADSLNLGGNITGTGTLTLQPGTDTTSVGIGSAATGSFHLSDAELARIQNGFTSILVGRTTSTATTDLRANTWNDPVTIRSSATGSIIVNGNQTGQGNASINIAGPATFNASQITTAGQAITLGGATTLAEGLHLLLSNGNAAGNVTLSGTIDGTAGGADEHLTIEGGTGGFTSAGIIGGTTPLGNMTVTADQMTIGGNLNGTGTLLLQPFTPTLTIGIGPGAGAVWVIDTNEQQRLDNTWNEIIIGRTNGSGTVDLRANTWVDPFTLRTGTGTVVVNGAQNMGSNNLTISADVLNVNQALTGTGILTLQPGQDSTPIGIGSSSVGTFNLINNEITQITNGWAGINIGRTTGTGAIDLRGVTFNDPVTFRGDTSTITTNGNITGAGDTSFTFNVPINLGHNITTASQNITFEKPVTLAQSVTLSTGAGAGDITFNDLLNGNSFNLTLTAGLGSILFDKAVSGLGTGTGAALTVNSATLTQANSTLSGNSGLNITGNSLWKNNITLADGNTGSTFSGETTFDAITLSSYDGITFSDTTTLGGNFSLNSHGGNVHFADTVDGAYDFTLALGGGNLTFDAAAGGTSPFDQVSITDAGTISADAFHAASFTSTGTGNVTFAGTGLSTSGDFSASGANISGDFTGQNGTLVASNNINTTLTTTGNFSASGVDISGNFTGDTGSLLGSGNVNADLTTTGDFNATGANISGNFTGLNAILVASNDINATLVTTGDFSASGANISGSFTGQNGSLLATNNTSAAVDVAALILSGQSASLTGKVGALPQDQVMADRITKTNTPGVGSGYTLNGFEIDYVPPAPAPAPHIDLPRITTVRPINPLVENPTGSGTTLAGFTGSTGYNIASNMPVNSSTASKNSSSSNNTGSNPVVSPADNNSPANVTDPKNTDEHPQKKHRRKKSD